MITFKDRIDAGLRLAKRLKHYKDRKDVIVLALPRGGVPVGSEVTRELKVPLDIFIVRKLGMPGHEELAIGAIASGGIRILNEEIIKSAGISQEVIEGITLVEEQELERRERIYRGDRPKLKVKDNNIILVDDGMATGASMRAAITALKTQNPARIIVAIPTAPKDTFESIKKEVDEIVCLTLPTWFLGVSGSYKDFTQTTDEEVKRILTRYHFPPTP